MADSSARNLNYSQGAQRDSAQPEKTIVLNPKSVPWSKFEKALMIIGSAITLGLMTMLVSASVSSTHAQHTLAQQETTVTTKQNHITDLRQEIGELTSSSRMNEIAKQQGLRLIESNIRNVR